MVTNVNVKFGFTYRSDLWTDFEKQWLKTCRIMQDVPFWR